MLERVPARWKVIEIVREKMTCRRCEQITQPPAPSHPLARGRAGPQLLAEVLFGKYGAHLPLNRQSDIFAGEGVDLDVSTMADWVGACASKSMRTPPSVCTSTTRPCRCWPGTSAARGVCGRTCASCGTHASGMTGRSAAARRRRRCTARAPWILSVEHA
jgi:hypothetical protein